MISTSQAAAEEDSKKEREDAYFKRVGRLNALFQEIDKDGSGCISEFEWQELCQDPSLFHELSEATSYNAKDLHDLFRCLAASKEKLDREPGERHNADLNVMNFQDFLDHLRITADPADKRCVLQVMAKLQFVEHKLERQIADLWSAFSAAQPPTPVTGSPRIAAPAAAVSSTPQRTPQASPSASPRPLKAITQASPSGSPRPLKRPSGGGSGKPPTASSPAGSARGTARGVRPSVSGTPRTSKANDTGQPPAGITKL